MAVGLFASAHFGVLAAKLAADAAAIKWRRSILLLAREWPHAYAR